MKALLLNSFYYPIQIVPWTSAIIMKYKGVIDVLEEYKEEICSPSTKWKMPAVIRLKRQVKYNGKVKFSKRLVFVRDNYTCQYCGVKFPKSKLTLDHVIPKKHGGRTTFENTTTCCSRCNLKKGSMSCDELGMFPINSPVKPYRHPLIAPYVEKEKIPTEWLPYLPQTT